MNEFVTYLGIGFLAQMVDGALGMAYGLTSSSCLMAVGVPPAVSSATVHLAETITTGASAVSHHYFGNIDRNLVKKLIIPGMLGAALGAYVLSATPGDLMKPYIAGYILFMGLVIIAKAFRTIPPTSVTTHIAPLGFFGAFVDSVGGGGWGPIVASTLLARGNHARTTVGSVNAAEFFVTLTSSITFILALGSIQHWQIVLALGLGGLLAAPLGGWMCSRLPHKPMMVLVGLLIVGLSCRTLLITLGVI
jgi:uncharacterized protein